MEQVYEKLGAIHSDLKSIEKTLNRHTELLFGNGSKGLKTRVIQLESVARSRHKILWAVFIMLLGVCSKLIYDVLT